MFDACIEKWKVFLRETLVRRLNNTHGRNGGIYDLPSMDRRRYGCRATGAKKMSGRIDLLSGGTIWCGRVAQFGHLLCRAESLKAVALRERPRAVNDVGRHERE
jgi:hypothetical protein